MKVAITGASGFVGGYLARQFSERGNLVTKIQSKRRLDVNEKQVTYQDLRYFSDQNFDLIVHAGALTPRNYSIKPNHDYLVSNLKTTMQIAEWAKGQVNTKFVFISTTHILEYYENLFVNKIPSLENDFDLYGYFFSKYTCEVFLQNFLDSEINPLAILRIATPFTKDYCASNFITKLIKNFCEAKVTTITSETDEIINLTWLDDVMDVIEYFCVNPKRLNIVDLVSSSSSLEEFTSSLSRIGNSTIRLEHSSHPNVKRFERRDVVKSESFLGIKLTSLDDALNEYLISRLP